ncbi:MAG: efflux RND transporter permease subunit, partial [Planctomycetota bacterium]
SLSSTLVIGVAIPISVIATFALMYFNGFTLNTVSFGGLALGVGMLVDNAIVVLESITRCREEGDSPMGAAIRGVSEVFGAIVASTLTTVAVFLPVVFVEGVAGQIFKQQALTVVFSLLMSLLVAIFVIPVLAAFELVPMRRKRTAAAPASEAASNDGGRKVFDSMMGSLINARMFYPSFIKTAKRYGWAVSSGASFNMLRALFGLDPIRHPDDPPVERSAPATGWFMDLLRWTARVVFAVPAAVLCIVGIVIGPIEVAVVTMLEVVWRYLLMIPAMTILGLMLAAGFAVYTAGRYALKVPSLMFDGAFTGLIASYRALLVQALAHRGLVISGALVTAALTVLVFPMLSSELIPRMRQGEFAAEFTLSEGMPLESTGKALAIIEDVMKEPEVAAVVERANVILGEGRSSGGERVTSENLARITVVMKRDVDTAAEAMVRDRIRHAISLSPDLRSPEFTVPTLFTLQTPLEIEVRSRNRNLLDIRDAARSVEELIGGMPRIEGDTRPDAPRLFEDVRSSVRRGNPEVLVRFDRELLDRHNLRVQDAANVLGQKLKGQVPTDFTFGDRRIDVLVEIEDVDKATLDAMRELRLTPDLSLGEAAQLIHVEGPAEIRRRNNGRTGVVSCSPASGVALSEASRRVRAAIDGLHFDGVAVSVAGESEEMQQSLGSLFSMLLLAVFLVYVVMAIQFESLVQPFIILFTVPLALFGVVIALWVLGLPISIVVLVGVIVLAGIVVNNAIVLIDRVNYNRARGLPLDEAILEAGSARLRPILITTLTTVLGLLPLTGWVPQFVMQGFAALLDKASHILLGIFRMTPSGSWDTFGEGLEIRAPMAITVVVGLTVSTLLTLVVIPVIYHLVASIRLAMADADAADGEH